MCVSLSFAVREHISVEEKWWTETRIKIDIESVTIEEGQKKKIKRKTDIGTDQKTGTAGVLIPVPLTGPSPDTLALGPGHPIIAPAPAPSTEPVRDTLGPRTASPVPTTTITALPLPNPKKIATENTTAPATSPKRSPPKHRRCCIAFRRRHTREQQKKQKPVSGAPDDVAEMDADEVEMMKKLGIPVGFDSTKGKPVSGANVSGMRAVTKRQPRQYMNRRGGFNRPLPAERNR